MIRTDQIALAIVNAAGRRDQLVKELAERNGNMADIVAACQAVQELERLFAETRERERIDDLRGRLSAASVRRRDESFEAQQRRLADEGKPTGEPLDP